MEVNTTILRKKQVYNSERRVSSLKRNNNNRTHTNKLSKGRFSNRCGPKLELGPILHEMVEGKQVESSHYSSEEFGKFSKKQCNAVI